MNSRVLLGGVAAAAIMAVAPAAFAQQTTSSISGVVQSEQGAPVAGAAVTIVHQPSGTRTTLVTDASGAFRAFGLRPGGPYVVTAKAKGFGDQTLEDVTLTVAETSTVNLALSPTAQEIVVTGARTRNRALIANVGTRTVLRADAIEAVVSAKRDIRDIGRRDPLAQLDFVNRGTGPSGGLYIAGSSPRRNRITIDGVRSQDDYGLNTGGLSTNRGPISFEAVEQVAIQAVPFDVEEGDFTGGALNLITKSGGNDFHGSLFTFHREQRTSGSELPNVGFVGNAITDANNQPSQGLSGFQTVKNKIHEINYGAFLSGPILKDKLFFAVSYENFTSFDLTGTGPSDGGFANQFNAIPGITTAGAKASTADINAVLANWNGYAASKLLTPGTVSLTAPIKDEKESVRFDYNITDGQRLTATYRHAYSAVYKRSPSTTSISLSSNWYNQPENEDNYSLQLNSKWNPQLSTEARIAYRGYQRGQLPPEGQGFANISICTDIKSVGTTNACSSGVPSISFGPDQFRQANVLKTTDTAGEFTANYRWNSNNTLKLGYQFKGIHIFNLFVQQAHGVYYFDSVADFQAGIANQLSYNTALTGNPLDAAAVLSYNVHTLLAQDTWDVMPGLTVNAGLRYDWYVAGKNPTLNTNFVGRYGFNNQATYDGRDVLMPRFSARWRTEKFELSGGVGLVSGGIPDVLLGNSYGAQTGALTNGFVVRRNADGSFTETAANLPITAAQGAALLNLNKADPSFVTVQSATAQSLITTDSAAKRLAFTNSIDPNFNIPADWKANIQFKTTRLGFDWQIDAVATYTADNIAFRDLRARKLTVNGVQQYTPDGRLRYDGLVITGATPAAIRANRAALGLPTVTNDDLLNIGLNGDIQAYNPSQKSWSETVAFSVGKLWNGLDTNLTYVVQDGKAAGGISEFGTTEGGNSTSGNYYADQTFDKDPNGIAKGKPTNNIRSAVKLSMSYKYDFVPGWTSHFTLFGEGHEGRPFSFLMTDPTGGRNPTFGVSRDDALAYVPNLSNADPTNPLKFTTNGTTVIFDSAASLAKFQALVNKFHLPQGTIVPRSFGKNPYVNRFDFQYALDIPLPYGFKNNKLLFTMDVQNLGNLLNHKWGVVKEYTNARAGGTLVNAQCADANGVAAGTGSATCATYRYSYTTASPTALAVPTIDQISSLYTIEFGLKYKF